MVVTRFAPSPSGFLHLGGARTALFNWLFAKSKGGKFLLRIDDTDKERSKKIYTENIKSNLLALGINWDGEEIYQSNNIKSHITVVDHLLKTRNAYFCNITQEEIQKFYRENPGEKYISPYRDRKLTNTNNAVVRLKINNYGYTDLVDKILGKITIANKQIEDTVLLRSDGTPTYILSSTVDDHDMNITDIIRGNDHINNSCKQVHIVEAMNWNIPCFAHLPLITDKNGNKLSKRQDESSIQYYMDQGYLSQAILNYLLRLGWSNGSNEIILLKDAVNLFKLQEVNKAPAKYDIKKLNNLNRHYLRNSSNKKIYQFLSEKSLINTKIFDDKTEEIISLVKSRSNTLQDILKTYRLFISKEIIYDEESKKIIQENLLILHKARDLLLQCQEWEIAYIKTILNTLSKNNLMPISNVMMSLRSARSWRPIEMEGKTVKETTE